MSPPLFIRILSISSSVILVQKTDQEKPKWFMVDLTFNSRAKNFVPLALLRYISTVSLPSSADDEPDIIEEISYLGRKGVAAIKGTYPFDPVLRTR